MLEPEPGRRLAFQQADEHAPPTWPAERAQQLHLDVTIDDIDEGRARAGAT